MTEAAHTARARARAVLARVPGLHALARLTVETIRICLRYRVTGLASEAGYFALLSLPPLVLGIFGGLGYVGQWLGPETVHDVTEAVTDFAGRFLTDETVASVLVPTIHDVLGRGRLDLISVGFLFSLWSGSRVLNVFVDTISIMYGQSGVRNMIRARALSLLLYIAALVIGAIAIPLVLIGPTWLDAILPESVKFLNYLYWPVVTVLVVGGLATLYYIATPHRTSWLRDLPGSALTLVIWVVSSFVVRGTVAASLSGGNSIYGPLSAPIVVLIWLYFLAIAVLIGAALNAAIRELWPGRGPQGLRASFGRAARAAVRMLRRSPQPASALPMGTVAEGGRFGESEADRLMSHRTPTG